MHLILFGQLLPKIETDRAVHPVSIMGGNKARKQAKKRPFSTQRPLRKALENGEIYASVTKLLGGAQCEVLGIDGQPRQCIIRNKFRGRGRRDNFLGPGVWCLVGEREWERARPGRLPVVDLLHVYSPDHKARLQQDVNAPWTVLLADTEDFVSDSVCFTEEAEHVVMPLATTPEPEAISDDIVDVDDI